MNIEPYIEEFIKKSKYCSYKKICKSILLGGKPFSLNSQSQYQESEYLPENIPLCVKAYTRDKDEAISLFRDFVDYLNEYGANVRMRFPSIPISNSFERLMFIAKYLQEENHRVSDLAEELWVSDRTIENDLSRLRGKDDPIQVCGKIFVITETERKDGKLNFSSTAYPLFLTQNLTQVIIMLKGLRQMSLNPLYEPYARASAAEIWGQLSRYAKRRIRLVLKDILPEELSWYESLNDCTDNDSFYTEKACSRFSRQGAGVVIDCMKNGKTWCMEYMDGDKRVFYKDCRFKENSYEGLKGCITMIQPSGEKTIDLKSKVVVCRVATNGIMRYYEHR